MMTEITVWLAAFCALARYESLLEQCVGNASVLACKRYFGFAARNFGL
jgi:hypothetical protein